MSCPVTTTVTVSSKTSLSCSAGSISTTSHLSSGQITSLPRSTSTVLTEPGTETTATTTDNNTQSTTSSLNTSIENTPIDSIQTSVATSCSSTTTNVCPSITTIPRTDSGLMVTFQRLSASSSWQQTDSTAATSSIARPKTMSSLKQQLVTNVTATAQKVSPVPLFGQKTVSLTSTSVTATTQTVLSSPASSPGLQIMSTAATSVTGTTQTVMASRTNITPEETNFLRFTSLVLKTGPCTVRHLFDLHNDPNHLDKIILDNRQKLENLLNNRIINKDHWGVLFPGNRQASSKTFDLTLMIAFLRDITGLKAPKSGWYRLPDPNDRSVEADLARIKYYRNKVAHAVSCSLNTHEFKRMWIDLSEAIIRLGGEGFKSEILAMSCATLDESYHDLYRELKAMKEDIIPPDIKFLMGVKVQGMATEDKTFVSTTATNSVKDAVDQYSVVMVTGPPGSGKTATVNHIALQLQKQGFIICPVVSTKEIIEYCMPESPQVFVFNDPFGIQDINQTELHQWTNLQERLDTCFRYSNMKILATTRSHIIENEQLSKNVLSSSNLKTVSFANAEIVLTDDEKLQIFNAHAEFKKRDDLKAMGVEIQSCAISCFPLLCRIYTSEEESKFSVKDFFQKPLSVISKDLDKFKINDPIRYFCLLYCMINDNNLDTDLLSINFESKTIETSRTILLEKCMVSTSLSWEEVKSKMYSLLNTYLKLEGKCYHFIHDIIHDAVIRHVNGLPSHWKRIILQHCGPKFLNERIRLSSIHYAQTDGYLIVNSDLELAWNERILHDMIYDDLNWNYMVNNTTLFSEKADKLLLKSLESIDQKELQKLILSSHSCRTLFPILEASNKLKTIYGVRLDLNEVTLLHLFLCLELKHCLEHILKTISFITLNQKRVNLLLVACILGKPDVVEVLLLNGYSANLCTPGDSSVLPLSSSLRNVQAVKVLLHHQALLNLGDTKGQSPLHIASSHGHVEVVKVLLKHKAELDLCDTEGQSPLHIASSHGHVEVVKVLLEHKAELNLCDEEGQSPLHIASSHGHVEVVKVLLEHKAKLDLCDTEGQSPLHIASSHGHVEVVKVLSVHNAGLDLCDNEGQSPLHVASSHGHVEVAERLLFLKAKLDLCDKKSQSPLHIASSHGHVEVVKVLVGHKAKLDLCDKEGQSPLHVASSHGHVEVVKVLLILKAGLDLCDKVGQSPLHIASSHGHVEVVKVLLEHKAKLDLCNNEGLLPLHVASSHGHVEVVKVLLEHKAKLDLCDKEGQSPLHIASRHGHLAVVEVLLVHKAKLDLCDKEGQSPLHIASSRGHVKVVKVLLLFEAKLDLCDKVGQSPLHVASSHRQVEVVKVLLVHKAKLDLCDKQGQSPLHIASRHGHVKLVKVLLVHKAKLDLCDKQGQSPLHVASSHGHVDVVKVLLEYNAGFDLRDAKGQSPLQIASSHGHVEVVKVLLVHKAKLDLCDTKGQSPLHVASSHGHVEAVKVLLVHKAKLDLCDTEGQSPLHVASSHGHVEVVKLLMEFKAKLDLCDKEGQSPLHVASSHGHVEVVKALAEHISKLDLCDKEGQSPLNIASSHGHVEVFKALVEHISKLDICDKEGQSPLHVASSHGHVEVVKVLLEYNAGFDLRDAKGQSPLHIASSHGHVEVVKVLLEHKAKLDLCDKEGQSPLHVASTHGHVEVVKLLLEYNAGFDLRDAKGQSPLQIASCHGDVEVVKVLLEHGTSFIPRHSIFDPSLLLDSSVRGHDVAVYSPLEYEANIGQRDKYGKRKNISPVKSNSDHSNLKVLRCRSPIEYLDCEDFNIKRSKECFQFCKTFCGTQLYTQSELHRTLKHALNILDAEQEEENYVTLDNTLLSLSKCGKSSYDHLLLAYNMVQLGANTKSADKYGNSNIHFAVQNSNVFLTIFLLQNRNSVVLENTIVDVLKSVIDLHKKKCQHGNIWDKNTKCEHAVIARYISYLIAFQYQRELSDYCKYLKVWPGYKHQDEISSFQGLQLVVQYDRVRKGYNTTVSITPDIPVIWHNVCIVSTEGKYMNLKTQEHEDNENLKREFNNFTPIDKQTAKMLFKCHRNLNIISVSMLKSVGYGTKHDIIEKPCVTLYCDVKGIIPVGEEDFKFSLPGHDLDIREGHFSFAAGGRSHEYHGQLKMGCVIGTPETFPKQGTLGGFVEHKGKTYLLTCAHVLFSIQELQRQMSRNMYDRKVVQPQDRNKNEIGQVRKFRFPKNTDESETSVDAALVEISSRLPVDGTFPDDDLDNLERAGYEDLPTFRSGEIKASIEGADRRNQVVKFGAKTGLTIGNFNPHKNHVRIRNDDWWITEVERQPSITHHIQIFNQYEISPLGNSTFAVAGDSGSFVFTMKNNDENRLQCIGMVIGLTSAGTVLVTPISSILESLFLNADSLKTFDPSAIVERRHANHDPLFPNNVNGALDEGKRGVERRFLLFIVSFGVFILAILFSAISK